MKYVKLNLITIKDRNIFGVLIAFQSQMLNEERLECELTWKELEDEA